MTNFKAMTSSLLLFCCFAVPGVSPAQEREKTDLEKIQALYEYFEQGCLGRGWAKVTLVVEGRTRKLLWKGPGGAWKRGAVIALHGGGGACSNFGFGPKLAKHMVAFSERALEEGFAVFSLDSTDGVVTDGEGRSCGKRWDCVAVEGRSNVDVPFIEAVVDKTIPSLRPSGSADPIFMTGISNGGFMTTLASTSLPGKITAFAPVSAGDPYGTFMDMGTHPPRERVKAPGVFRDSETGRLVTEPGAAKAESHPKERPWPSWDREAKPPFKQFHHRHDGVCDFSCMEKARALLVEHGFSDEGAFILDGDGIRNALNHFWMEAYNRPLLEFFIRCAARPARGPGEGEEPAPAYEAAGPFSVRVFEFGDARDSARENRRVPIKVHAPAGEGPFPLVVLSHGGGGNWDANLYQARHLASHGYVVACVEHVFSNNKIIRHYMTGRGGRMKFWDALQRITTDPRAVLERPRDVSFAIDSAVSWNDSHEGLKDRIDAKKIAVMGHSYGAFTTLVVCGARPILDHLKPEVGEGSGLAGDLSDPRVTFGLAMSPQGLGTTFFGRESYKTLAKPLVCLSGTKDTMKGARGEILPPGGRLRAFVEFYPRGDKHMLWLRNADHMCFSRGPRAHIFPSPALQDGQHIAKAVMVLACDAYLKDSKEAKDHLGDEYLNTLCGPVVTKVTVFRK
ncbi:MAG: alpha/beta hydrolase [Planctomycetota bacterium]|jgi:dienelactone hydrolase